MAQNNCCIQSRISLVLAEKRLVLSTAGEQGIEGQSALKKESFEIHQYGMTARRHAT